MPPRDPRRSAPARETRSTRNDRHHHRPGRGSRRDPREEAAHASAAAYYAEQLRTPEASTAREFLQERGFDQAAAERFGCGYAPAGWDSLTKHLQQLGFTRATDVDGGFQAWRQAGLPVTPPGALPRPRAPAGAPGPGGLAIYRVQKLSSW